MSRLPYPNPRWHSSRILTAAIALCAGLALALPPTAACAAAHEVFDNGGAPCWAPSGTGFICTGLTPDGDRKHPQIWDVPFAGTPTQLTDDPYGAWSPLWLPDGEHFVYLNGQDTFTVYQAGAGVVAAWPAPDVWPSAGICLSPDGSEVLYAKGIRASTAALDLATGAIRDAHSCWGGAISPDGQWIAYFLPGDTLSVEPLGGGPVTRLAWGAFHAWTRDSKYIIYTGLAESGNFDMFVVGRDGTACKQLTDDPEIEWQKSVSPSGTQVLYARSLGEFGPVSVWVADIELPTPVRATTWGTIKHAFQ